MFQVYWWALRGRMHVVYTDDAFKAFQIARKHQVFLIKKGNVRLAQRDGK